MSEVSKPVPRATTITWAKMVGYAKGTYGTPTCLSCVYFDKRGQTFEELQANLGGCTLHSFIPYTSKNNTCEMHERPE